MRKQTSTLVGKINQAAVAHLEEFDPKWLKFAPAGESRQPFFENLNKEKTLAAQGFQSFLYLKRVMGILNISI